MVFKVIKTEDEYRNALRRLSSLMDAELGTPEGEELELLSLIISGYENANFPIALPDPIDAIKFRMEQQGLTQKDLKPLIGSQSKVSEVLNHKRPLSLSMIRNLNQALEIPAEVLIQKSGDSIPEKRYSLEDYPFNDMYHMGFFDFSGTLSEAKQQYEECLEQLFSVFIGRPQTLVLCRNSEREVNQNALRAWQAKVLAMANRQIPMEIKAERIGIDQIKEIVRMSAFTTGPLKALDYLAEFGIPLVILQHLPKTYLDGACFRSPGGRSIIGLTLRHDRQDNYWFTLVHELAHIFLHLQEGDDLVFMDDTERAVEDCDAKEMEANQLASDLLIPAEVWERNREQLLETNDSSYISKIAENLGVCPAIIAGRIRHEKKDYSIHSKLLGGGEVRSLFLSHHPVNQ
jgi:HTH-type transcriptional regulator/antitoxin HigA